ncbi:MAG: hypothetical protein E7337_07115 [Clostridiales bacterium]|nr:hypothetical protein [Clostridiales bacterium]
MKIGCVWEHNGQDTILYACELPGAYARGASRDEAMGKMHGEVLRYLKWAGRSAAEDVEAVVVQDKPSELDIRDADSDVLFESERGPMTLEEYEELKALALKSAGDFLKLYDSVADKDASCLPERKTFYGSVPRTAREMYMHTLSVNSYYFGEIDVEAGNEGNILQCRKKGFEALEAMTGFLENRVVEGSYSEEWSLRKVLRRFIWHDRIHARAMYRMALKTFGKDGVEDVFGFDT